MAGAPIELLALNEPYLGVIRARREGEPSLSHVQSVGDAFMAAQARAVNVVIPESLVAPLREAGELPPDLPSWVEVVHDR